MPDHRVPHIAADGEPDGGRDVSGATLMRRIAQTEVDDEDAGGRATAATRRGGELGGGAQTAPAGKHRQAASAAED